MRRRTAVEGRGRSPYIHGFPPPLSLCSVLVTFVVPHLSGQQVSTPLHQETTELPVRGCSGMRGFLQSSETVFVKIVSLDSCCTTGDYAECTYSMWTSL